MEYKLQKSTNHFSIKFIGAQTNELELMYDLSGRRVSPRIKHVNADAFIKEFDESIEEALRRGDLTNSADDYKQDRETELAVNLLIRAYKTIIDPSATFEVTEI